MDAASPHAHSPPPTDARRRGGPRARPRSSGCRRTPPGRRTPPCSPPPCRAGKPRHHPEALERRTHGATLPRDRAGVCSSQSLRIFRSCCRVEPPVARRSLRNSGVAASDTRRWPSSWRARAVTPEFPTLPHVAGDAVAIGPLPARRLNDEPWRPSRWARARGSSEIRSCCIQDACTRRNRAHRAATPEFPTRARPARSLPTRAAPAPPAPVPARNRQRGSAAERARAAARASAGRLQAAATPRRARGRRPRCAPRG